MANALNLLGAGPSGASGTPGPPAPTGFAATPSNDSISLEWDDQTGVLFDIYYGTNPSFGSATELISGWEASNYTPSGIQAGEKYYFWVRATNETGDSAFVGPVSARAYVTLSLLETKNLVTPTGSWVLSTLFFRTGGNLPGSCFVSFDGDNKLAASVGDGTWNDEVGGEPDYDPPISGSFTFSNLSGGAVTFWDTDPV